MPNVSIIVPTYDRVDLVQEAIDSVLCQSLAGVEVVVVDDGSTDGTGEVLESRYGDRIHYYYQSNQGRSAARNLGIRVSTGDCLLFLDSDDLLLPEALAVERAFLDSHPEVDIVYTDGYFCDRAGRQLARIEPARPPHDPSDLLKALVLNNVILACHSAMVRRTALDSVGFPYLDDTMPETEDQDLWIRLAALGKVFAYLDVPTCMYRLHSDNASRFDPLSPAFWVHQESVRRGRFKILQAEFFSELPVETRERFFYELLVNQVRKDETSRDQAVESEQFAELPSPTRARLLYRLGKRSIVDDGGLQAGRGYLEKAVEIAPRNSKYRVMHGLARYTPRVFSSLLAVRRGFRRMVMRQSPGSPIGHQGLRPLDRV